MKNCLFCLLALIDLNAFAIIDEGVRAQSFGGAYRALADTNNTLFYNPAGLIKNRRLSPDIDYMYKQDKKNQRLSASIVDSSMAPWALGLAYLGNFSPNLANNHNLYLGLAMPIMTDMFSLGGTVTYKYNPYFSQEDQKHFFNFDLGFLFNSYAGVSLSLTGHRLMPKKGQEEPFGAALGFAFEMAQILPISLTFAFDWLMDHAMSDDKLEHVLATGLEYKILYLWPLRIGLKSPLQDGKNYLSLGTGILFGTADLDLLYQQNLALGKERQFGLALRLYF